MCGVSEIFSAINRSRIKEEEVGLEGVVDEDGIFVHLVRKAITAKHGQIGDLRRQDLFREVVAGVFAVGAEVHVGCVGDVSTLSVPAQKTSCRKPSVEMEALKKLSHEIDRLFRVGNRFVQFFGRHVRFKFAVELGGRLPVAIDVFVIDLSDKIRQRMRDVDRKTESDFVLKSEIVVDRFALAEDEISPPGGMNRLRNCSHPEVVWPPMENGDLDGHLTREGGENVQKAAVIGNLVELDLVFFGDSFEYLLDQIGLVAEDAESDIFSEGRDVRGQQFSLSKL